jgi:single-strand DNA-binding protein
MAASINKVFLMGNLTRDPELRYVPSGTAVANFTVAVNRAYATQTGEKKEEVTFVRIIVWGRRAEVCGEYLSKGSPVFVEGRLRTRSWQTPDGQNRSTIEVVASNVQFLSGAGRGPRKETAPAKASPEELDTIDIGGDQAERAQEQPNAGSDSGDEIPF